MPQKIEFKDYFPVAVLHYKIDDDMANAVCSAVEPELSKLQRTTPIVDYGGDPYTSVDTHATDFWDNKIQIHKLVPDFFEEVRNAVLLYQEHTSIMINPNFKIRYWTQDYSDGDSHDIHNHGIHGISGTYYMRANSAAGPIRFYNPNQVAGLVKHMMSGNPYCADTMDVYPEKGTMLIFPSYLKHKVVECNEGAIRTSISFDICPG